MRNVKNITDTNDPQVHLRNRVAERILFVPREGMVRIARITWSGNLTSISSEPQSKFFDWVVKKYCKLYVKLLNKTVVFTVRSNYM